MRKARGIGASIALANSIAIATGIFLISSAVAREHHEAGLAYPIELRYKVEFWKAIYTKYTTRQGVIHDAEDLSIIYDAIELPRSGETYQVETAKSRIRENLFNILRKHGENLTPDERKILAKFPDGASRARLLEATENIRFQLGQADRFKEGVIRSGYYMKHIQKILKDEGVPDFLRFLPHVESSFQENAISKFGAAGLWQLMESAGREFLTVNYAIDQRLDPWLATHAAARHLKRDYESLKAWPLAITAYNHGAGGVMRAVNSLGTEDIAEIAFRYTSPSFGFASRNFYAQFLAATEVASDPDKYFGPLPIPAPVVFDSITLKKATYYRDFAQGYKFTLDEFRKLNPSLRQPVLTNQRPIPNGTLLRVPPHSRRVPILIASLEKKPPRSALAKAIKIPELKAPVKLASEKKPEPVIAKSKYAVSDLAEGKGWITVEMNETIAQMADWLKVDLKDLRAWNGIEEDGQARLGQRVIVKFDKTSAQEFEAAREDYHQKIREDFFARYDVSKLDTYEVKRGENLWSLCYQKFDIPPWLLQEYNQKISLTNLEPGTKLKIPMLKEKDNIVSVSNSDGN